MLIAAALVLLIMLAYVLVVRTFRRGSAWPGSRSSSRNVYQKEAELQTQLAAGAAEERGAPAAGRGARGRARRAPAAHAELEQELRKRGGRRR